MEVSSLKAIDVSRVWRHTKPENDTVDTNNYHTKAMVNDKLADTAYYHQHANGDVDKATNNRSQQLLLLILSPTFLPAREPRKES